KEKGELHVNQMAIALNIPIRNLTTQLFELEMEGKIKTMPGGMFRLVR
ncbi:MAG TPA: DNA-protecting protein DprA, partial [Porphyromonadaceae bacterium]|nr:DNA-protecting protein DprA [Porphyromonadaceae bacterium]